VAVQTLQPERTTDLAKRPHVVHVVTASMTARLMRGQLRHLREAGFDVTIVSAPGPELEDVAKQEGVTSFAIPMEREIAPLKDLKSLWLLWRLMCHLRPTIVNVGTAKAGLLAGIAARLAGVPCRTYTLHGLRLETTAGLKRFILTRTERLACRCANQVICVSNSVRDRAIELGLAHKTQTLVLGSGSFNGVEDARFAPTAERLRQAAELRRQLGIEPKAPVIGFIGRFTRDKGIVELVEAFDIVRRRFPEVRLLLLGRFEDGDPVPSQARQFIETDPGVIHIGYVPDPAIHYQVIDILALPTYREGFPTVVLEAAAAAKPVVAARATGTIDAVQDKVTGLLVPGRDAQALANALLKLIANPQIAAEMGKAARYRVEKEFPRQRLCEELTALYRRLLHDDHTNSASASAVNADTFPRPARLIKRALDIAAAAFGIAVTGPLMAAAAVATWVTMGLPIFFRQYRAGYRGRAFPLVKFRTMSTDKDDSGRALPDHDRLTPVGRILRRFSIDELPQFWNVLKGDMSLVGPRPLLLEYLPAYTEREQLRHAVRPGLTGYSQIKGRHALRFSKRLELDSWYVENWSLTLDLNIVIRTIPKLLFPKDSLAYQNLPAVDDRGLWRYLNRNSTDYMCGAEQTSSLEGK